MTDDKTALRELLEKGSDAAFLRARYITLQTIGAVSDTAHVSLPAMAN